MNKYKINKDSWHYKLVKRYIQVNSYTSFDDSMIPNDFCSYFNVVVKECLNVFLHYLWVTIVYGLCLCFVVAGIWWVSVLISPFVPFLTYDVETIKLCLMGLGLFLSFVIYYLFQLGWQKLSECVFKRKSISKQDGLISMKFKSWKEKYCPMLEFYKDEEDD